MKKRIECVVTGRVQMVMYRDFVARNARRLGVVGIVENKEDGSVRVVAEGEESLLHELIMLLRKGSLLARVDDIRIEWKEEAGGYSLFRISYR